jgi:hypothetical protein
MNGHVKTKLLGYHFRAHPKLDPHHLGDAEFQPKIVCNHQITMLQ